MILPVLTGAATAPPGQNQLLEELLADLAGGEIHALEALYAHTKTSVYGFALSILRHPQQAEDVMQETYVRLYHAAGTYRPQGKPMAWVLTIVRNLALMKLRAGREIALPEEQYTALADPGNHAENAVNRLVLHTALHALSKEERQIVVLHSVSGLRHREIAAVLGIPLSTTLSKYRRALSKLRKLLKEEEQ